MQTSRVRSAPAAADATMPRAGTIASRNGSATVAPTPRRNVRRGMCFPVMKSKAVLLACRVGPLPALPIFRCGLHLDALHEERVALDHAQDERGHPIVVRRRRLHNRANRRLVEIFCAAAQRVREKIF